MAFRTTSDSTNIAEQNARTGIIMSIGEQRKPLQVMSKRGKTIIDNINSIYEQVGESVEGTRKAIMDAEAKLKEVKAKRGTAKRNSDFESFLTLDSEVKALSKEVNDLKARLNKILEESVPSGEELLNDLMSARAEETAMRKREIIKHLQVAHDIIVEQLGTDTTYSKAAILLEKVLTIEPVSFGGKHWEIEVQQESLAKRNEVLKRVLDFVMQ